VRLRDLATLAGVHEAATVTSDSVQPAGYVVTLGSEQVADEQSLLALRVNGIDLSLDHGFPARVISPAVPGTHCTKWVSGMQFSPVPA
jgi:DMSO/TMAO reductase YedYZ molybdopterin-dependent catalytic subunit